MRERDKFHDAVCISFLMVRILEARTLGKALAEHKNRSLRFEK